MWLLFVTDIYNQTQLLTIINLDSSRKTNCTAQGESWEMISLLLFLLEAIHTHKHTHAQIQMDTNTHTHTQKCTQNSGTVYPNDPIQTNIEAAAAAVSKEERVW